MRVDREKKEIIISVGELAGEELAEGSHGLWFLPGRAGLGRRVHRSYQAKQAKRYSSYRQEVFITYQTGIAGFRVTVQGRVDGLYEEDGDIIVEEIKSVVMPEERFTEVGVGDFPSYEWQLKLYAYLVLEGQQGYPIKEHLILINLLSSSIRRIEVVFSPGVVKDYLEERVKIMIKAIEEEEARGALRRRQAKKLRFPYSEVRQYQDGMISQVNQALEGGRDLMISAPSGIGKTVGVLYPCLKFAFMNDLKVFFATPKTTQQRIVQETLERIKEQGVELIAVILRAREKACPNDVYFCHPEFCPYLRDYRRRAEQGGIIEELLGHGILHPDLIVRVGRREELCPFELSLDLAMKADVIVGDYNYVFDPSVTLRRLFMEQPYDNFILIIDEAHNLYPRGREYYSPAVSREELKGAKKFTRDKLARSIDAFSSPEDDQVLQGLQKFFRNFEKVFTRLRRAGEVDHPGQEKYLVELDRDEFIKKAEEFEKIYVDYVLYKKRKELLVQDDLVEVFFFSLNKFKNVIQLENDAFSHVFDRSGGERIQIICKDPSEQLGGRIAGFYATVGMSATLEPVDFYRGVLGFDQERTDSLGFPSPFPVKNRKILILPQVSTTYRKRGQHYKKIGEMILDMVRLKPGNYLAFFPSFEFLKNVRSLMEPPSGADASWDLEILCQSERMPEYERAALLERLQHPESKVLVMGVQGGIFSEGVDYPGGMAIGAFVVSPALPRVSFEQELMREYYEQKYGLGFEYAYLYPGMNRVIQSVGRVIRTKEDRGIIVLMGERFARHQYYSLFPEYWYKVSPKELVVEDYVKEIQVFWEHRL